MAFAIVEFTETVEVEVFPSTWIEGDICCWPGGKADSVNKLVRTSAKPQDNWAQHPVEVKGVFCSYENARMRLERSQFTSDLATSDDEQPRRPVHKPKRLIDSDSDQSPSPPQKRPKKPAPAVLQPYPQPPANFPSSSISPLWKSGVKTSRPGVLSEENKQYSIKKFQKCIFPCHFKFIVYALSNSVMLYTSLRFTTMVQL
ncbi:uncharacterized protein LOC144103542 [Amblyomma americanum]